MNNAAVAAFVIVTDVNVDYDNDGRILTSAAAINVTDVLTAKPDDRLIADHDGAYGSIDLPSCHHRLLSRRAVRHGHDRFNLLDGDLLADIAPRTVRTTLRTKMRFRCPCLQWPEADKVEVWRRARPDDKQIAIAISQQRLQTVSNWRSPTALCDTTLAGCQVDWRRVS